MAQLSIVRTPKDPARLMRALAAAGILTAALTLPSAPAQSAQASSVPSSPAASPALESRSAWLAPEIVLMPRGMLDPILIRFAPDESRCQKAYGDAWAARCAASLGRSGAPVQGVSLTPEVAGRWTWNGPDAILFEPENPWPSGKTFRASLAGLPMPPRFELLKNSLEVVTPPLTLEGAHSVFWADPSTDGERIVSFEFWFTTAAEREKIEKAFALRFDAASGLKLDRPVFLWAPDSSSVFVKVPVLALPKTAVSISALLPGVAARCDCKDGRCTVPKGFETASDTITAPGLDTLMRVTRASVSSAKDEALENECVIRLDTTLAVKAAMLSKALEVYALPAKLDAGQTADTDWQAAPVIDDEVLSRAQKLDARLDAESTGAGAQTGFALRVKAAPGSFLFLKLPQGFGPEWTPKTAPGASSADASRTAPAFGLKEDWTTVLKTPILNAEVRFLQPGNVLSLAGAKALSLYTSGVEEIHWRIARVRDDFLAIAANRWRVLSEDAGRLPDNLMEAGEGRIVVASGVRPGEIKFAQLSMDREPGLYEVVLEGRTRGKNGVMQTVASQSKRVLLTDTALIVKKNAQDAVTVFAGSLSTGKPQADAEAVLLAENGTVLERVKTDELGRARFRSTAGLTRERRPTAVVVRTGAAEQTGRRDLSWISLTDSANRSNAGDVVGMGRESAGDALTALAFTERGVYRAGETIHFGAVVKRADFAPMTASIPLLLRLSDDAGRVVESRSVVLGEEGLISFDYAVPPNELPGRLRLDVMVADGSAVLATAAARIEDFAPETLSLTARLEDAAPSGGWIKPADLTLDAALTSLFGGAASGRRISGRITAVPLVRIPLPQLPDYRFESPAASLGSFMGSTEVRDLDAVRTDSTGKAQLRLPLSSLPIEGWAEVSVVLEGFEAEGGRAATHAVKFLAGRGDALVGWKLEKTPQPTTGLLTGEAAALSLAAVDRSGRPLAGRTLTVNIAERRYAAALTADVEGRPVYSERLNAQTVSTTAVETDADGKAELELKTDAPGDWLVTIADESGAVLAAVPYRTIGSAGKAMPSLDPTLPAAQVRLTLSRASVDSGEPLAASILSPFKGFGLLTLESDDVVSSRWIRVDAGANETSIDVPEHAAGKFYAHLSLVRDPSEAERYLEGYAEAVAPVIINEKPHTLAITIDATASVEGAKGIPVTVKADAPAKAFVWAVDDGILSLTNYQTPDPMKALFEDRALQVETRQVLDRLMPEIAVPGAPLPPFGGDFEAARAAKAGAAANPFKRTAQASAVWWGGLVDVDQNAKTLMMNLPESFNGRVRIMAAGADADKAGSAQKMLVRQAPLVLEPMLPRAAAPGDRFRMGAVVSPKADLTGESGRLSITAPSAFGLTKVEFPLNFADSGAASASADFRAPNSPMTAEIRFAASAPAAGQSAQTLSAERTMSLSVRPAALWQRTLWSGRLDEQKPAPSAPSGEAGGVETRMISLDQALYPYEAKTSLTLSRAPLTLAVSLADSFRASPWAGVSEAIAAALPLSLSVREPELAEALLDAQGVPDDEASRAQAREALYREAAARRMRVVEALNRSLGYEGVSNLPWLEPSFFETALAADYLISIGRGIEGDGAAGAPVELVRRAASALERQCGRDPITLDEARTCAYALWVLAREGTMTAARMKSLIAVLNERFPDWRSDTTVIFLAGAAAQMRMTDDAQALLEGAPRITTAQAKYPWSPEIAAAAAAAVYAEPVLAKRPEAGYWRRLAAADLAQAMRGGPVSPVYAAMAARAAVAQSAAAEDAGESAAQAPELVCTNRAKGFKSGGDKLAVTRHAVTLSAPGCLSFSATGSPETLSGWFYLASAEGYPSTPPKAPVSRGLSIERRYLDADGQPKTAFSAGELVVVSITLRVFDSLTALSDIDVVDLLPGGFELADPPGEGPEGASQFARSEDRMRFTASVPAGAARTFTYRVRAVTPGEFTAGAVSASSLSRPNVFAQGIPSRILIDAP